MFSAASLVMDRELGFLREMMVAPVRRSSIVLGKCLGGTTIAASQGVILLALAGLVHVPYDPVLLLGIFGLQLLIAFTVTALGVMVATTIKQAQTFTSVMQMLVFPMIFLSGALYPVSGLPSWLRRAQPPQPADLRRRPDAAAGVRPPRHLRGRPTHARPRRHLVGLARAHARRGGDRAGAGPGDAGGRHLPVHADGVTRELRGWGMEYGAHLPLMDFGGHPYTLDAPRRLRAGGPASSASTTLAANDHLVFASPWLDGPTALAAVIEHSGDDDARDDGVPPGGPRPGAAGQGAGGDRPALRRPAGRRRSGPGSSPRDYEVGRARLRGAMAAPRRGGAGPAGAVASRTASRSSAASTRPKASSLRRGPRTAGGPPIWIGSWGSDAGLRRAARLADGWLASAYNTTPGEFAGAWDALCGSCSPTHGQGRAARSRTRSRRCGSTSPTTGAEADRVLRERLVPTIHRPEEVLRERLPVGPAGAFAEKLLAFGDAGVQRVLIWPVADEARQLELFCERVARSSAGVGPPDRVNERPVGWAAGPARGNTTRSSVSVSRSTRATTSSTDERAIS